MKISKTRQINSLVLSCPANHCPGKQQIKSSITDKKITHKTEEGETYNVFAKHAHSHTLLVHGRLWKHKTDRALSGGAIGADAGAVGSAITGGDAGAGADRYSDRRSGRCCH